MLDNINKNDFNNNLFSGQIYEKKKENSSKDDDDCLELDKKYSNIYKIDIRNRRYPYCLVMTPVRILSWIFPVVGHMGIAQSDGVVRDFYRSYRVSIDTKRYSRRLQIMPLNPKLALNGWDQGIKDAASKYNNKAVRIFSNVFYFF